MLLSETPSTMRATAATAVRLALLLVALGTTTARAQNDDTAAASPRLAEPDLRLRPGATVHVAAPSVGQLEGTLVRADGLDIVLRADGAERPLHLAPGDSLWVLGHSARKGMAVGATVGLVAAIAVVGLYASSCSDGTDFPCSGQGENYARAGVAFGLTGAAVGALVGWSIRGWERRWP
jgi:hypothetical protein